MRESDCPFAERMKTEKKHSLYSTTRQWYYALLLILDSQNIEVSFSIEHTGEQAIEILFGGHAFENCSLVPFDETSHWTNFLTTSHIVECCHRKPLFL